MPKLGVVTAKIWDVTLDVFGVVVVADKFVEAVWKKGSVNVKISSGVQVVQ